MQQTFGSSAGRDEGLGDGSRDSAAGGGNPAAATCGKTGERKEDLLHTTPLQLLQVLSSLCSCMTGVSFENGSTLAQLARS